MSQAAASAKRALNSLRARGWLVPGLIILLTVLAYLPAMRGGFIWDDDDYVTGNLMLHEVAGLKRIWTEVGATPQYYPLVHTTFWMEHQAWGLNPMGYHIINVLLHGLGAILLWRVLVQLALPGAWLAAAIFALHPVQVESVAWITERKNVLSGVFYFAAALAYLRFNQNSEFRIQNSEVKRRLTYDTPSSILHSPFLSWRLYFLALVLFLCALLSKTVTCSLPAALLLIAWWRKGKVQWRDVLPLVPFFVIGAGLGWHTAQVEKQVVLAVGADWALSFSDRVMIAGRALWFYAAKLVWPVDLTFIYPRWEISTVVWWQWIFPIAALAGMTPLWILRNRIGRGSLVGVLFFTGTLFPALGFFNVFPMRYSFVADHFQYLASVGLIVLVAEGLSRWMKNRQRVLMILPMGLGLLTWQQTHIYRDLETLWRDTLAKNPTSWMAHHNLAMVFLSSGRYDEAERQYRAALKLKPDNVETLNDFGVVLFNQGKVDEAIGSFQAALRLDPNFMEAMGNLGDVLAGQGRFAEAIPYYESALQLRGSRTERRETRVKYAGSLIQKTRNGYGIALMGMGRVEDAIGQFQQVLLVDPNNPGAHCNLGNAFAAQNRNEEAQEHYKAALRATPKDVEARHNLGVVLGGMGRYEEAIEQFREVLRVQPEYASAHDNLGLALAKRGQLGEAAVELRESLRYAPTNAMTHFNLGNLLALQQDWEGAAKEYLETLRLSPGHAQAHINLGKVLVDLGRREEAIEELREGLKLQPDSAEAKDMLKALGVKVGE